MGEHFVNFLVCIAKKKATNAFCVISCYACLEINNNFHFFSRFFINISNIFIVVNTKFLRTKFFYYINIFLQQNINSIYFDFNISYTRKQYLFVLFIVSIKNAYDIYIFPAYHKKIGAKMLQFVFCV